MSAQLMDRRSITSLRDLDHNNYLGNYNGDDSDQSQDNGPDETIKLQLKKPKAWNWELSTSKSSPNIAFPRIMLYNEKGTLLADAQEADCVFRGPATDCRRTQSAKTTRSPLRSVDAIPALDTVDKDTRLTSLSSSSSSRGKKRRSSTTNLPDIDESLNELLDQLESNGFNYKLRHHLVKPGEKRGGSSERKLKRQISTPSLLIPSTEFEELNEKDSPGKTTNDGNNSQSKLENFAKNNESRKSDMRPNEVEEVVPDLPILVYSEKGVLQRDFNAKEFDHLRPKPYQKSKTTNLENIKIPEEKSSPTLKKNTNTSVVGKSSLKSNKSLTPNKEVRFDLQKSKSAINVGEVEHERKFCRRTNSSGPSKFSGSILERMSAFKRRSSSTDSQDVEISIVEHGPRYFLRTSKAGTLVVCEESFRNRKVRRRPRSCSRISEVSESNSQLPSSPQSGREKIIQKYSYPAAWQTCEFNKDSSHYDEAIAKIDNLISKVSLKSDSFSGRDLNQNKRFAKYLSVGDVRAKNEPSSESRAGSTGVKNGRAEIEKSNSIVNVVKGNEKPSGEENKSKRKKRKLRRCVSASTFLENVSSDEEDVKLSGRENRSRSKSRSRSRNDLRRRTVQIDGETVYLNNGNDGDQILTLNNNLSAVQSIGSTTADIIDESTDEVLLRLVQRLASIKQNQKDISHNHTSPEESTNANSFTTTNTEETDENKNYSAQCINIADCEDYETSHRPVQRQTTLLSHELLLEESSCGAEKDNSDDDDELSDEYISYTIAPLNDLNGFRSEESKEHTPCSVVTSNIKKVESDEETEEEEDSCSGNYRNEFAITDECDETNDKNLLADSNMGSNVSRNSGKGLTGRRSQSSGNLYSDKREHRERNGANANGTLPTKPSSLLSDQGCNATNYNISNTGIVTGLQNVSETCPGTLIISPLCAVSKKDRNKFCGSLPNHLDTDDIEKDSCISDNYNIVENSNVASERIEYVTVAPCRTQLQQQQPEHQHLGSHSLQQQQLQQHHHQQQQQSPYNNSLSEKETASTSSGSSTFKINQDRPDIQLKLPLTRSNFDPCCDQGYGSERSPEDEFPPAMPHLTNMNYQAISANPLDMDYTQCTDPYVYDFIQKDCTFHVPITKGPRGLGLSISGGIDSNAPFPGLIRIKRLFPHQAAWSTGQLQPGDIILEVNGISLTGLTNYAALEVLRTMPTDVVLLICRPNDEQYQKLSPPTEPPKPPQRTQQQGTQTTLDEELYPLQPLTPLQTNFTGEFEIIMVKQQGSLGFTLRKEDESVLGHYVRALVREPATTDGRIKPGDKIVAVNDVPLSAMTHEQAVIFLRQAADTVKLRLYRDEAQTPVAAMSPTNSESKTICGTMKKAFLRPEAINLLSDLAYKKQTPSANSTGSSIKSTNSSPRRLKRNGNKANSSEMNSQSEQDTTDSTKSSSNLQYIVSSQTTSVGSDSDQSVASQCTYIVQTSDGSGMDAELFKMDGDEDRPDRPSFLDLAGQSGSTPMVPRKPRFQFSVAANAYELNNLDNDALDAPIYNSTAANSTLDGTTGSSSTDNQLPGQHEFASLPCETFLIACKTESDLKNEADFNHRNPLHQSFHVPQNDDPEQLSTKKDGNKSLLKWKGVVFSPDDGDDDCGTTAGTKDSSGAATAGTERSFDSRDFSSSNDNGHKVITVELNRGWNSRLGFSLQPHPDTQKTVISAIYSDSVAARDGRLKVGDQLLTVNDESIENMTTSDIIDLMRIIRGSIVITVLRKDDPH